ncbi:hypothetical protein ABIB57_001954 [Devosia sp. UYZn731]|uniref:DUF6634 family protein n=1 Tax=Devosia sp. UYZn731 TaxID=3156345 RepID=UPI003399D9D3
MREIIVFESIVDQVALKRPEIAKDLRRDIALLSGGTLPTAFTLAAAPSLDKWLSIVGPGVIQLTGFVTSHPIRQNGLVVTSALCAIDCRFRWARTSSRYYRLLSPLHEAHRND